MEGEKVATVKNHWMLAREAATRRMEAKAGRAPKPAHTPGPRIRVAAAGIGPAPWSVDRTVSNDPILRDAYGLALFGSRGAGDVRDTARLMDVAATCVNACVGLNPDAVPGLVEAAQALLEALRWHFVPAIEENINSPMAHAKDREIDALRAALAKVREG